MRRYLIALLFACALPAAAQSQEKPPTSAQLQDFVGQYVLADGREVSVVQRQRTLVAQVTGENAVVLRPNGAARYISTDGKLTLQFDQRSNGNVAAVVVATDAASDRRAQQ